MEGAAMNPLISAVSDAISTVIGWLGTVLTALTGSEGDLNVLLPLLAVGIVVSVIMLTIKIVRSFSWGA